MNQSITNKLALKPLSLCLSAAILAACGGTAQNPGNPNTSSTPTSSSAPASSSSTAVSSSSSSVQSSSTQSSSSSSVSGNPDIDTILASSGMFEGDDEFTAMEFFSPYIAETRGTIADIAFANGHVSFTIADIGDDPETDAPNDGASWHVQITHGMSVSANQPYTVCFKAKADSSRTLDIGVDMGMDGEYLALDDDFGFTPTLTTSYQSFESTFYPDQDDSTARVTFNAGSSTVGVQLDDVGVFPGTGCGTLKANEDTGNGSGNIDGVSHITTSGNQVLFGGQQGSIAGISLFWSQWEGSIFYNAGAVSTLKSWGAKLVRAAMGADATGGYITDPGANLARVRAVVQAAVDNDMYVIIDWHSHHAEEYKSQAIEFFTMMAQEYGHLPNVIFEIYNEPIFNSQSGAWSSIIKPYALDVIKAIRDNDPDEHENLIIVGTRVWSQRVDEAARDPITQYNNIAYTLHFYAGTHGSQQRQWALDALTINGGIPLFATEWGTTIADGGAIDTDPSVYENETRAWMSFLKSNNISHANWSLVYKNEGSAMLKPSTVNKPTGGWTDDDLTASGLLVKDIIQNW